MRNTKWVKLALALGLLAGCSAQSTSANVASSVSEETSVEETSVQEETTEESTEAVTVHVGSLKGPTSMGLVNLMKSSENGATANSYEFTMATAADEIAAGMIQGSLDIALVPANLASVLYNKTEGQIEVIDINTLGVLYCISGDESITSVNDLAGKTVITTGQGTTPEYSLRYLLDSYGITDCNIEFKSEATEVASALAEDPMQIAVLPQPFATAAQIQNEALHSCFSLSDEWDKITSDSRLVTGVTIVRKAFLEKQPAAVEAFLAEHAGSVEASKDVDTTSELVAEYGIVEKAPVAKKALPFCSLVCITGDEMKTALSGYLEVLFNADPTSVGGKLPEDDFYFVK